MAQLVVGEEPKAGQGQLRTGREGVKYYSKAGPACRNLCPWPQVLGGGRSTPTMTVWVWYLAGPRADARTQMGNGQESGDYWRVAD